MASGTSTHSDVPGRHLVLQGLNTTGDDFAPITVELKEGGA